MDFEVAPSAQRKKRATTTDSHKQNKCQPAGDLMEVTVIVKPQ